MHKKKTLLLSCVFTLLSRLSFAQESSTTTTIKPAADNVKSVTNRIYFEALGNGLIYSVNFDRQYTKSFGSIGYRLGTGYTSTNGTNVFALPIAFNVVLGKSNRSFETGIGTTFIREAEEYSYSNYSSHSSSSYSRFSNDFSVVLTFGYRSEPKATPGFSFRAGFTPTYYKNEFVPYLPYLSLGYKF